MDDLPEEAMREYIVDRMPFDLPWRPMQKDDRAMETNVDMQPCNANWTRMGS